MKRCEYQGTNSPTTLCSRTGNTCAAETVAYHAVLVDVGARWVQANGRGELAQGGAATLGDMQQLHGRPCSAGAVEGASEGLYNPRHHLCREQAKVGAANEV